MSTIQRVCLVSVLAISGLVGTAWADNYSQRQYYGNWHKAPSGYSYRPYYYKPSPTYVGYKHHYVIHSPKRPGHHYYYNPYSKKYWGRCPVKSEGKAAYSLLAEKDRGGDLEAIAESAFPPPGKLPALPESSDGALLDLPPDDLPAGVGLPE